MIKRLAHVNIGTDDLKACEDFYCGVLGMKKVFEFVKGEIRYGFYVEVGNGTYLEFFDKTQAQHFNEVPIRHLCLEVEDIDAAIATIRERGWEIEDKKFGADQAWQAWFKDPNGVAIELMQYTDQSSQFTGQAVEVDW